MKIKKKYLYAFILIFILCTIFLLCVLNKSWDYSINYKKFGYLIQEEYDENSKMYYIQIIEDDKKYEFSILNKYIGKKIVDKVLSYSGDNYICLDLESQKFDFIPSCYSNSLYVSPNVISDKKIMEKYSFEIPNYIKEEYENVKINTLLGKKIAIWDNKGFIFLSDKKKQVLDFLKNENYYDTLSFMINRYVLIPNYDEKFSFKTYYVLDLSKGKINKWNLKDEISFNSYYLGEVNNKGYIVDRKNKNQLEINPSKKNIEVISINSYGKIWNNKWEPLSMVKLINNDYSFNHTQFYNYSLKNGKLFMTIKNSDLSMLISNKNIDKIVYSDNQYVYYLVGDKLYSYSNLYGEVLMLTYTEWNFNKENPIYIY